MPSASATRLYVEGGEVRCGEKAGRRKCKKLVMRGGKVMCNEGHEFSIAELIHAAKRAGLTLEDILQEYYSFELYNPLVEYRRVQGLVILGDIEIEAALKTKDGGNPLELAEGWCRQQMPAVPWSVQQLINLVKLCRTPEWNCQPVLTFEPPEVLGNSITLARMYEWWGDHHKLGSISARSDIQKYDWFSDPLSGGWRVYYQPTPVWSRRKHWISQQEASESFGLTIRTAPEYTWMMDLWRANGLPENSYWARTTTKGGVRWPMHVYFHADGIHLSQSFYPEAGDINIGAAVEGVPLFS